MSEKKESSNKGLTYGKNESAIIAGIAIVLMLIHHMFGFPKYLRDDVQWFGIDINGSLSVEFIIAHFGKICVALFAFNTGYAMWVTQKHYTSIVKLCFRGLKFLIGYWICCTVFLLFGLAFEEQLPDLKNLLLNLVGINCSHGNPWINVSFAWYVSFYLVCLVCSPLIIKIFKSKGVAKDLLFLIIIRLLLSAIQKINAPWLYGLTNDLYPLFIVCSALLVAKYNLFEKAHQCFLKDLSIPLIFVILTCLMVIGGLLRIYNFAGSVSDFILAFAFISLILELLSRKSYVFITKMFLLLGANSMMLWFLHGLFFTGSKMLQPILYLGKVLPMVILTALIILLPISHGLGKLHSRICKALKL